MKIEILLIFLPVILRVEAFFDIQLEKMEIVEQDLAYVDASKIKVRKYNKTTRAVFGEVEYIQPFDNTMMLEGKIYKKQGLSIFKPTSLLIFLIMLGGEYRLTPYKHLPSPFCMTISSDSEYEI